MTKEVMKSAQALKLVTPGMKLDKLIISHLEVVLNWLEPVEPIEGDNDLVDYWKCPICEDFVGIYDGHCATCGKALRWGGKQ